MPIKSLPLACLLLGINLGFAASAFSQQKIDIQAGVKAPANVKADGKLTEWTNLPLAYNKATKLHYMLANDVSNLYIAFSCADHTTISKILAGGVTIAVNTEGKKKQEEAIQLDYPVGNRSNLRYFRPTTKRQTDVDSQEVVAARKAAINTIKEINVFGIKDITDTVISIYNTYGIKSGSNFDAKGELVCELAIPLKYLNLNPANATEIACNIQVNPVDFTGKSDRKRERTVSRTENRSSKSGDGEASAASSSSRSSNRSSSSRSSSVGGVYLDLTLPTDFWEKYKLAKP